MQHVSDIELIEYAAGRLSPAESAATAEHVAACAECRRRCEQTRQVWQRLGEWRAPRREVDLAAAVVERARPNRRGGSVRWAGALPKAAAAVLLAVTAGHLAGRWARPTRAAEVDANQVMSDMHLNALGVPSPVGLAEPVLAPAHIPGEERR